ncbi:MAG: SurA N-terminal domain-containing protein [Verrucomicrobiota bacterium]|nr:SurA N-terminal domain-containing protein [Verrucomicrobiota bacterium]
MRLITKFNTLIRSRLLWGAFVVVVSITFIGVFSQQGGCEKSPASGEGRLFDRVISTEEFGAARRFTLGFGEQIGLTRPQAKELRKRAWQRLALLGAAERLGLLASDSEVRELIRRDQVFTQLGAQRFKNHIAREYGIAIETYEAYLKDQIVLSKLYDLMRASVWLAPAEMDLDVRDFSDRFNVEFAFLSPTNMPVSTNVTEEAAREFYRANTNLFAIPFRMNVRYVEFPFSNYTGVVAAQETDIKQFYDDHLEDFAVKSTNGIESAKPLDDDVRANIMARLVADMARDKAREQAMALVLSLTGGRYQQAMPLEEAIAKMGSTAQTSAFFAADETIPGLDVGPDFYRAAFELDPSRAQHNVSDVITGDRAAYVMTTCANTPGRIPEFAEVADRATDLARSNAQHGAFLDKARGMKDAISDALAAGKSFDAALKDFNLNVATTRPFSVFELFGGLTEDSTNAVPHAMSLVPAVMRCDRGQLSDLAEAEGGLLLAFVADRRPGDPGILDYARMDRQNKTDRFLTMLAFGSWADYFLAQATFEDFHPMTGGADSEQSPEDEAHSD